MSIRRLTTATLTMLSVLSGGLALNSTPAPAFTGLALAGHFGTTGTGDGELLSPGAVAINQTTGYVYVVDRGDNRIEYFTATGNYVGQFNVNATLSNRAGGIAVDNDSASPSFSDVYVIAPEVGANSFFASVDKFDSKGKFLSKVGSGSARGGEGHASGVAVDSQGDLWVYGRDVADRVVRFDSAVDNEYLSEWNTEFQGEVNRGGTAVDSHENVYVPDLSGNVLRFSKLGVEAGEVDKCECSTGLTVDSSTNDLYVDQGTSLVGYGPFAEPFGQPVTSSGAGSLISGLGVAVDQASGRVYVADSASNRVDIFKSATLVPDVTTEAASNVGKISATLTGSVNPDKTVVTSCEFEYGTDASYGKTASCSPAPGSGGAPVAVTANVVELKAGATYHYRLIAGSSEGANVGEDETFNTMQPVDSVSTGAAEDVTRDSAKLTGALAPDGTSARYYFEYGKDATYGSTSPAPPGTNAGTATETVAASTELTGLEFAATYHYRLVTENEFGISYGEDQAFTTPAAVEGLQTEPATAIEPAGATLNGVLQPNGVDAHYYFQYGESEKYGSTTGLIDAGSASETLPVSMPVSSLRPGTVYHFRLAGENSFGTTYGQDQTFTTTTAVGLVLTESPSEIQSANATLHGLLSDSKGLDLNYWFEYGETETFGSRTATQDAGIVITFPFAFAEAHLTGLNPNTTYYYRLGAENTLGTVFSEPEPGQPQQSFTTIAVPPVIDQPASTSNATRASTVMHGTVNPEHSNTTYHFEYVEEAHYQPGAIDPYTAGGVTVPASAGASLGDHVVEQLTGGLKPSTTYHYALVASNQAGMVTGSDGTFSTGSPSPPIAATGPASEITQNNATISATINTQGEPTAYGFQVGTSTNYGPPTGLGSAGAGANEASVTLGLTGLQPGTTYHYRIEATSIDGTTYGADQTFTTTIFANAFVTPPAPLSFVTVPPTVFPTETKASTTPRALTSAQKLANALKACKKKTKSKRSACEKQARKRYPSVKKKR